MSATLEPPRVRAQVTSAEYRKEHGLKHTPWTLLRGLVSFMFNRMMSAAVGAGFVGFAVAALSMLLSFLGGLIFPAAIATFVGIALMHTVNFSKIHSTPRELREEARLELYPNLTERRAQERDAAVKAKR